MNSLTESLINEGSGILSSSQYFSNYIQLQGVINQ